MRNRLFQRADYTNREYVMLSRAKSGDCTYCPPNHNENARGGSSKWGRKVAAKRKYATGKGRKEVNWAEYKYWDLTDKHYLDPFNWALKKRRRMYCELDYGDLMHIVKDIGRQMYNNPAAFAGKLLKEVNSEFYHEGGIGWENDKAYMSFKVRSKRKEKKDD